MRAGGIAMSRRTVGREPELETLRAEFARAATGTFRTVLVSGDPGMGKTRLAHELLSSAPSGVTVLRARGHVLGTAIPFGLWAEAFESHLRGLSSDEVRSLCGGSVDDLAVLLRSAAVTSRGVASEPPRARLVESLAVLLRNIAETGPVIVLLDDFHLGDNSSWEALHYCARNLRSSPVLVVVTVQPAGLVSQPGPIQVLFDLEQDGDLARVELGPLAHDALKELAEAALGMPAPPALVAWLDERARGNPLFTLGLLQALRDEKADLAAPRLERLPEGLTERIGARLAGLPEPSRATLDIMAAAGRRMEFPELVLLAGCPAAELGPMLDDLVRARLITGDEGSGGLVYEITHPLVQKAIYERLGPARRRAVHRTVGQSLLDTGRLGEAAPHIARSAKVGDHQAVDTLCQAARQAESREAFREALIILGSLAEILPQGDERWLEVVDGMVLQADWIVDHRSDVYGSVAVPALRAIDGLLPASSDPAKRAALKLRLAAFLTWGTGDVDQALQVNNDAQRLFEAAGDRSGALLAALDEGIIQFARGNVRGWAMGGRQIADEAQATGEPLVAMHALGLGNGFGALVMGDFNEAEAALQKAATIARQNGKRYFESLTQLGLALTLGLQGRIDDMEPFLNEAKVTNPCWQEGCILEFEAVLRWVAGDFNTTLRCARESVAWFPGGMSRRRGFAMAFAALAAAESGRMEEAQRFLALGHAAYEGRPWGAYTDLISAAQAVCDWRSHRRPESLVALEEAAVRMLEMEVWPWAAFTLWLLADVAAESRRREFTGRAVAGLVQVAEFVDRDLYRGLAALGRATDDLLAKRHEQAAAAASEALQCIPVACRVFSAQARDLLGRALIPLDRPQARTALEAAAAEFGACGAFARRDRTVEHLRRFGHAGKRSAAALGDLALTPRERDVARLAARGQTAPEIAEALVIGTRTVETHLVRIYAKLAVRSKRELTQRAAELGLQ